MKLGDWNVKLASRTEPGRGLRISYRPEPTGKRQSRLVGRYLLRPEIRLDDFTCRAVLDWIDVEVALCRPVRFRQLQKHIVENKMRKPFVEPLDPESGTRFRIRVQEPRLDQVEAALSAIEANYGLLSVPLVTGVEISVDFFPKSHDPNERQKMVALLVRHLIPKPDLLSKFHDRPRSIAMGSQRPRYMLAGSKTDMLANLERYPLSSESDEHPPVDATYYLGARDADLMFRIMDKIYDRRNPKTKTAVELAPEARRARVEVHLRGALLERHGIKTLDDLRTFDFERLQGRYFSFWLPTFKEVPRPRHLADHINTWIEGQRLGKFGSSGALGLTAMDQAWNATRRKSRKALREGNHPCRASRPRVRRHGTHIAYAEVNKMVRYALRHLSEREREKRPTPS